MCKKCHFERSRRRSREICENYVHLNRFTLCAGRAGASDQRTYFGVPSREASADLCGQSQQTHRRDRVRVDVQFCPRHSRLDRESAPTGPLKDQIEKQWGSIETFQKEFVAKGVGLFGSGWVWLQADDAGTLSIGQYAGADNPVAHGLRPILTFDVWEHAYYLDYQNRRAAQLEALWGIVDWKVVEERCGSQPFNTKEGSR